MHTLHELPNIGSVLENLLNQVGIHSEEELKKAGSKEAFRMIKLIDPTACQSMLMALEGAIEGVRWHNLADEVKQELKAYFKTFQ
ncbi:TfoX/Sxy family protein [Cytobacillus sp. Hz8]|uniref:TfoX/Sxy family protein n=1 Tax=Cytobacillus sp. Hz8 TaxID=3347168 RepID=UPI0035D6A488